MKITGNGYHIHIECESEHEVVKTLAAMVVLAVEMKPNAPVYPALASTVSHLREGLEALQQEQRIPSPVPASFHAETPYSDFRY